MYNNDQKLREHAIIRLVGSVEKQGKYSDCINYSKKYSTELPSKLQKTVKKIQAGCESDYKELLQSQQKENS